MKDVAWINIEEGQYSQVERDFSKREPHNLGERVSDFYTEENIMPYSETADNIINAIRSYRNISRADARTIFETGIRDFMEERKDLYENVLNGNFDDVTLQQVNEFVDNATPRNKYYRPLSKRLPSRVLLSLSEGERTNRIDALFSRISESAVRTDESFGRGRREEEARTTQKIEETKKHLLKQWAIATGNWHTDISDFTNDKKPIGSGKDSDVYVSKDGNSVIKFSHGKPFEKRFRPDIDTVALFNAVFLSSEYKIIGYGEHNGKFVTILQQPIVDFSKNTPLTEKERVDYMAKFGFHPINDEKTAFSNGIIIASDLQKGNIVKDENGHVQVIDADMKLHTKDVGGKYFYPDSEVESLETPHVKSVNAEAKPSTIDQSKIESSAPLTEREPLQRKEGESIFAYADRVVDEKARTEAMQNEDTDSDIDYSRREEPAPKKTIEVFKLMRLEDDDKLYPLFIDNSNSVDLKAWYNADSPDLSALKSLKSGVYLVDTKTNEAVQTLDEFRAEHPDLAKTRKVEGYPYPANDAINYATEHGLRWMHIEDTARGQKRFGGESRKYWNIGINGSGVPYKFSMRPGWHAGSLPTMRQIGKGSNRDLRDDKFVWVKGEISADIDYNEEAQHNPDKDIPDRIPKDGFYLKATNANKTASQADKVGWYVAGAFKPNQVISDAQARKVIDDWNAEHGDNVLYDFAREGGKEFTDEDAAPINKANGVDFSKREEADIDRSQREGDDSSTKPERKKATLNETKEIWNDQNLSLQERITAAMAKLAAKHQDDKTIRNDAMQAIGGNIASLRKAMATQRKFDQSTVKRVAYLAQILITSGHLSGLTAQEVKRLLAVTKGSVGRKQIGASIANAPDLKESENGASAAYSTILIIKIQAEGTEFWEKHPIFA